MKPLRKILPLETESVLVGQFSKREGGVLIARGERHVHSSSLKDRDTCVKVSRNMLSKRKILPYPWELLSNTKKLSVTSSQDRYECIRQVILDTKTEGKRVLREKVEGVLEELLTNSIYHAYQRPDGNEKYERKALVTLQKNEIISVTYACSREGVFFSVVDQGGKLSFDQVSRAFARCYNPQSEPEIETKQGGAGLGIYLIFEAVTHLKIVCQDNRETKISCWIGEKNSNTDDFFSFNFFKKEG